MLSILQTSVLASLALPLLLLLLENAFALQKPSWLPRRQLLLESGLQAAGVWLALPSAPASAARGAAELDFEFYMRDLVGGNKKGGTILPSAPPVAPPPRQLKGPLIPLLLDSDCSPSSVTVQALIQQIKISKGGGGDDERAIAKDIQARVQDFKAKASRGFYARSPWQSENISDQYYFDFTSYALWRVAADLLPDYLERDKFVRRIGKLLYQRLVTENLIKAPNGKTLSSTVATAKEILELFQSSQYCKGYKIRGELDDDTVVFDDLDDDTIATGGSVDCLVSIYEPANLQASLQITGEQSRFAPDFVGTTIAALYSTVGVRSAWVTFFVDPKYRPNPKDYFPNEELFQYTLTKN